MGPVAILGQYCNIRGFQLASTAQLVPVSYSGLVFAALLGLVVFDEWPRPATIAGAALIVAGAIWLARRAPLAPTAATQPVHLRARCPWRDVGTKLSTKAQAFPHLHLPATLPYSHPRPPPL